MSPLLDVVTALAAAIAAAACARAARRASPRGALAWRFQLAACAIWGVDPLARAAAGSGATWLAVSAAASTWGFSACVLAGMLITSRPPRALVRVRGILDACVGATALLSLHPVHVVAASVDLTSHRDVLVLLRPVVPLLLAIYYLTVMVTEIPVRNWAMFLLLSAALAAASVAEGTAAVSLLTGAEPPAGFPGTAWLTCFASMAAAGFAYRGTSVRRSTPPTSWVVALAPYVLVLPGGSSMWADVRPMAPATGAT